MYLLNQIGKGENKLPIIVTQKLSKGRRITQGGKGVFEFSQKVCTSVIPVIFVLCFCVDVSVSAYMCTGCVYKCENGLNGRCRQKVKKQQHCQYSHLSGITPIAFQSIVLTSRPQCLQQSYIIIHGGTQYHSLGFIRPTI